METEKTWTYWDMWTVKAHSVFEQKEIYNHFTNLIADSNDKANRKLGDMWKKQLKSNNPFNLWDYIGMYGIPVILVTLMVLISLYTNLTSTIIVGCCCFIPLIMFYGLYLLGRIVFGGIVMSMQQVKKENNL